MSINISKIGVNNHVLEQKITLASLDTFVSTELNLKTSEGDLISLSFDEEKSLSESSTQIRTQENKAIQGFSSVARAATTYSQVVQGDLNAEELAAINKLAEEISPLVREFFENGEFNLEEPANVLANNLGVIRELELALERTVVATFATRTVTRLPEDGGDTTNVETLPTQAPELEIGEIRDFPALAQATLDSVLESEAGQVPEQDSILRSLNDLLSLIRDRLDQFLNPPTDLAALPLESAAGMDGVANIDTPVLKGSEPPNQLEQ
jgi:exosome complex RNA-binding protein Rrp42 (RNase PH superfamily)